MTAPDQCCKNVRKSLPGRRPHVTQMYGAAVRCKRFSSICRLWILHQCIRPQIGAVCSGPSWISARVRSHYRQGLKWAIRVTSVRMRREDRSSISSHPLADLGGKLWCYVMAGSLSVQFLCSCHEAVPSSRLLFTSGAARRGRQGRPSRLARLWLGASRPCLDGTEHGATLKQIGTPSHWPWRIRSCAPC